MLKERMFNTGAVTINYAQGPPSGHPLILLHGGGDRWQQFLPIIPDLVLRWHIFAPDLRGHGKSGRVPGKYRPEHYVADVLAFLEHHCTERMVLFGHSLGGWIALMAAAELTNKVRALILGDPPLCIERFLEFEGSEERRGMWRSMRDLAASGLPAPELASALADLPISAPGQDTPLRYGDLPGVNTAHLSSWAKTLSQVDPDVAQYHAEGRLGEYVEKVDIDAALRRLTCPVLLLQGGPSQGGVVSDSDVQHAVSMAPGIMHVQLVGAGHDLGLGTWKVTPLLRTVTNFLESL